MNSAVVRSLRCLPIFHVSGFRNLHVLHQERLIHLLQRIADVCEVAVVKIERHDEKRLRLRRQRIQLDEAFADGEQHLLDLRLVARLEEASVDGDLKETKDNSIGLQPPIAVTHLRQHQFSEIVAFQMADVSQFLFEFDVNEIQQRLPNYVDRDAVRQARFVEVFAEQLDGVVELFHVTL